MPIIRLLAPGEVPVALLGNVPPSPLNGTSTAGTSNFAARADHNHDDSELRDYVNTAVSGLNDLKVVNTIAERNALTITGNYIVLVIDASADPEVGQGSAKYVYRQDSGTFTKLNEEVQTGGGGSANPDWGTLVNVPEVLAKLGLDAGGTKLTFDSKIVPIDESISFNFVGVAKNSPTSLKRWYPKEDVLLTEVRVTVSKPSALSALNLTVKKNGALVAQLETLAGEYKSVVYELEETLSPSDFLTVENFNQYTTAQDAVVTFSYRRV